MKLDYDLTISKDQRDYWSSQVKRHIRGGSHLRPILLTPSITELCLRLKEKVNPLFINLDSNLRVNQKGLVTISDSFHLNLTEGNSPFPSYNNVYISSQDYSGNPASGYRIWVVTKFTDLTPFNSHLTLIKVGYVYLILTFSSTIQTLLESLGVKRL